MQKRLKLSKVGSSPVSPPGELPMEGLPSSQHELSCIICSAVIECRCQQICTENFPAVNHLQQLTSACRLKSALLPFSVQGCRILASMLSLDRKSCTLELAEKVLHTCCHHVQELFTTVTNACKAQPSLNDKEHAKALQCW